jgi:hypothetical protein
MYITPIGAAAELTTEFVDNNNVWADVHQQWIQHGGGTAGKGGVAEGGEKQLSMVLTICS